MTSLIQPLASVKFRRWQISLVLKAGSNSMCLTKLLVPFPARYYGLGIRRFLSSGEVSTALRPFYFQVHPDLFERYPQERAVNENSLKQLNNYIETLMQSKPPSPTQVEFYLRRNKNLQVSTSEPVKITLRHGDIQQTLRTILSSCKLPTQYVDNLQSTIPKQKRPVKSNLSDLDFEAFYPHQRYRAAPEDDSLHYWLRKNVEKAKKNLDSCRVVREEICKLQESLRSQLGLQALRWECGWGTTHFRGCLQSFQNLALNHAEEMKVLKSRTVVFGTESGISLQGHVILNSGEVRHNWCELIRNLDKYEVPLKRVPALEAAVSTNLLDIKITHRKFSPVLLVEAYESQLRQLTTSLGDYRGRYGYPKEWPESLKAFQLVVEGEAGPLMLSPSGQFIVPASCPASLLVSFISGNLQEAAQRLRDYDTEIVEERKLVTESVNEFQLESLTKDDNVTPAQMTNFCCKLLKNKDLLQDLLAGTRITVTHYYSVLTDGEMCIPWNWK